MLDPYKIVRPTQFPETRPCRMTDRGWGRLYATHVHRAYVDQDGNGRTDMSVGHFHYIRANRILPANDQHEHNLTNVPCGAGGR